MKLRIASTYVMRPVICSWTLFSLDCLLLDDRPPVSQVRVRLPLGHDGERPARAERGDHGIVFGGSLVAQFHLARARDLHQEVADGVRVNTLSSSAADTLLLLGRRLRLSDSRCRCGHSCSPLSRLRAAGSCSRRQALSLRTIPGLRTASPTR